MIPRDGPGSGAGAAAISFVYDRALARAMIAARPYALLGPAFALGAVLIGTLLGTRGMAPRSSLACTVAIVVLMVPAVALMAWRDRARAVSTGTELLLSVHGGRTVRAQFDDFGMRVEIGDDYGYGVPWTRVLATRIAGAHLLFRQDTGIYLAVPLSALGEHVHRVRALASTGPALVRDLAAKRVTPPSP